MLGESEGKRKKRKTNAWSSKVYLQILYVHDTGEQG